METGFNELFPDILDKAQELYGVFSTIGIVLVFAGVTMAAWRGTFGDLSTLIRSVATAGIIAVVISVFPDWIDQLQAMAYSVVDQLDASPAESHRRFAELIVEPDVKGEEVGAWDILWADKGGLGMVILYGLILLFANMALAVMWICFIIQKLVLVFGVSVSPLFISMLALGVTRSIGVKFLLGLLGTICIPIGWAVSDIFTASLLKLVTGDSIGKASNESLLIEGAQMFFVVIVISLWILVSTLLAPKLISKMLQHGSQIGADLLSGFGRSLGQGTGYAVGAGVTAAMQGGGKGAVASASTAGGLAGVAMGAASSGSVLLPAAIGTLAAMSGSPTQSSNPNERAEEIARKVGV